MLTVDTPARKSVSAQPAAVRSTNKNPLCNSPDAKRIVIVDDHPLFRKGLQEMIHSDGTFAVCGEAGDAAKAMEVIRQLHPDLVIVDPSFLLAITGLSSSKTSVQNSRSCRSWCSRCTMIRFMRCGRCAQERTAMN